MSRWAILALVTAAHGFGALAVLAVAALAFGWRIALAAAGTLSLVSAALVALVYRSPAVTAVAPAAARVRVAELRVFLRRPGVLVVLFSGLVLSIAQSSVLAYLALYTR